MSGLVFIISAPSGSGKSTLVNEIRKVVPNLEFSISYTTREPRGSEQNGREYYFVSREEFEKKIAEGEFLEYAEVFCNYYGTSREFLHKAQREGKDLLLDIDVQGAAQVKEKLPEAVSIFVLPPDRDELVKRLTRRSQAEHVVSEEVIRRRLQTATQEVQNYSKYDYILVNDRLEDSIDELKAIVTAERLRRSGSPLSASEAQTVARAEECRLANVGKRLQSILNSFAPSVAPAARAKQ
jgi:guanylate kinase